MPVAPDSAQAVALRDAFWAKTATLHALQGSGAPEDKQATVIQEVVAAKAA